MIEKERLYQTYKIVGETIMKIGGLKFKGPYWDIDKINEMPGCT